MPRLFSSPLPIRPQAPKDVIEGLKQYQEDLDQYAATLARGQALTRRYLVQMGALLGDEPTPPGQHEPATEATPLRFVVGSLFLYDCQRHLSQYEPEWLVYATGIDVNGLRTLDRMVTFKLEQQSVSYVKGDAASTRDALCDLEEFGYRLHAALHSHRMRGLGSVSPSGIDTRHQARLERGGYRAVSGIFSDDGFVRFFSVNNAFQIESYGKGVEQVEAHVFKLTALASLPHA